MGGVEVIELFEVAGRMVAASEGVSGGDEAAS